jgi:hypothetical protein
VKKLTLLFAAFLLWASHTHAQDKGFVAIHLGPSLPMGDLAGKSLSDPSAGFAKTGYQFDASFGYKLADKFGVTTMIRRQSLGYDVDAIAGPLMLFSALFGSQLTVESTNWGISSLLAGGYGDFAIGEKIAINPRLMVGLSRVSLPEITIEGSVMGTPIEMTTSADAAMSFSYLLGAGGRYNVSEKIFVSANLDYLGAKANFKNIKTTSSAGGMVTTEDGGAHKQSIATFNIGVGAGLRF